MIWLSITMAAYAASGLAGASPMMEFRCAKHPIDNCHADKEICMNQICTYDALVVYDSKGKKHTYKLVDVQNAAIRELQRQGVKEDK